MKLFRKVASVLATAVMLGSTVGVAAAANYPAPFVQGGASDVGIVIGAKSLGSDAVGAAWVTADLATELAKQTATGVKAAPTPGAAPIKTGTQELYLGDYMNTTKELITKDHLSTLLASGTILDEDGTSYNYDQKIYVPNTYVAYGKTSDNLALPVLHVYFESSMQRYSSRVIFPTAINITKAYDKEITLFGKKFVTSPNSADLTTTKIVLFGEGVTKKLASGESATVEIEGKSYTIEVTGVESATSASLVVNGVSQSITEGKSYKVAGLNIYVKDVIGAGVAGEWRGVELWLGSTKLTLENGQPVVVGTTTLDGTLVTITSSGGKIQSIDIRVTPYSLANQVKYLKAGDSFTDPVFKTFSIHFAGVDPTLESEERDLVVIKPSGETKAFLKFTNKAGATYELDILKPSSTCIDSAGTSGACNATYPYNATTLGFDTYDLIVSPSGNVDVYDYFVVGNNEYTQIFRLQSMSWTAAENYLRVLEAAAGKESMKLTLDASNKTTLTLADGSTATITVVDSDTVNVDKAVDYLYTKGGAKINLANANAPSSTLSRIEITEETGYNAGDYYPVGSTTKLGLKPINVTLLYHRDGRTGYDMEINRVEPGDGVSVSVGDYDAWYLTNYGSFIKREGQYDRVVSVFYPSAAAHYDVYIKEVGAEIAAPAAVAEVKALGAIAKLDTQIAEVKANNLIVVGGTCINAVAAELLGVPVGTCEDAWVSATGVKAGEYLIQVFNSPYTKGKIAMLVAGYEAEDTIAAVTYLLEKKPSTDVGTKLHKKSADHTDVV